MKLAKLLKAFLWNLILEFAPFSASTHLEIHFEQLLNMDNIPYKKVSTFRATWCKFYSQAQHKVLNGIISK